MKKKDKISITMDMINLIVKVQQFEDKRILAKASWNIRELKGKLSEIYPTVSKLKSQILNSFFTSNLIYSCQKNNIKLSEY